MNLEILPPFECKLAADTGELTGYGSTFGNTDNVGDTVAAGAFAKTLAEHKAAGTMPALLWSHDVDQPVGVWTEAKEDGRGLLLKGRLTMATQRATEARALAKDGALALSMGFTTRDADYQDGRRILKDVKLWEVSLVAIPANPQARLTGVKSAVAAGELSPRLIEHILRDAGVPKTFAKAIVAGGWKTAANSDWRDADGKAVHELLDAIKANTASLNQFLGASRNGFSRTQSRD